ncbi:DUF805 domain-containing protein [Paraliobacillus sediminis]|uniref:DUF805 domain-containing protein n=1 Tax=Paraliobacillus sediminis TaxID=1885916 RepID=UPI000E3BF681|nr:DUF805 domain-containing protein [Paraliobacillus sediminis]
MIPIIVLIKVNIQYSFRCSSTKLCVHLQTVSGIFVLLAILYAIFIFIPGIAVTVRRLHDISKSGFWILINFVPLVGSVILFVFTLIDSDHENIYGPNPKFE